MILKRQDLLGEQGNYLNEEALAQLANNGEARALDNRSVRPNIAPNSTIHAAPQAAESMPNQNNNQSALNREQPRDSFPESRPHVQSQPEEKTIMAAPTITTQNLFAPNGAAPQAAPNSNIFNTGYGAQPQPATNAAPAQPNYNYAPNAQPQQPAQAAPQSVAPAPAPRLETRANANANEGRRLVVGPDISLNGEISTCDILVVEGTVQAVLKDCRQIEIAPHGHFKGNAELDDAIISGLYEGNLVVRGRLHVTSTGKIRGSVRYNMLQIDMGGELSGDVESLNNPNARPIAAAPAAAANQGQNRNQNNNRNNTGGNYGGFSPAAASGSY